MTLEEATRALREEGVMDAGRKRVLRDRVLATPKKRSLRAARWVMPLAAVLAAASVWASVTRDRHTSVVAAAPVVVATTATATIAPVIAPPPIETATAVVDVAPVQTAPHVTTPRPTAGDSERRALRAYREAERLQFDDKDYARALDAWDRYVPLAGKSPLLVDAKWQRAVCLVRLDRRDEARAALEPFARGELGAYRRDEAQALLGALK